MSIAILAACDAKARCCDAVEFEEEVRFDSEALGDWLAGDWFDADWFAFDGDEVLCCCDC